MYPASTATILRLFYNNTADVTHDTLWMWMWDEVRDYRMGGVASSSLPPDPFHSQPAPNTAACGLYSAAAPAPMWVFIEVDGARRCHHSRRESWRGCHAGHMAAWQHGASATCQHVTRKFPVGGGRGRGEHQQLAAVAGPILQPAGEIRSPAAPARRHQSTSQQSQHNYGEMNLIS